MSKGNESAFPEIFSEPNNDRDGVIDVYSSGGLTKREYFAAKAMQGLSSIQVGPEFLKEIRDTNLTLEGVIAENAVRYADALLAELSKEVKK